MDAKYEKPVENDGERAVNELSTTILRFENEFLKGIKSDVTTYELNGGNGHLTLPKPKLINL